MLTRKSRRIAHRTLTESDRWWDIQVALKDDCVEAFQTKIEFHEFDVNKTWVGWRFNYKQQNQIVALDWVGDRGIAIARKFRVIAPITRTPLSLAVHHGAVNCVAYLKEMGVRSYDCLPGSGYDIDPDWLRVPWDVILVDHGEMHPDWLGYPWEPILIEQQEGTNLDEYKKMLDDNKMQAYMIEKLYRTRNYNTLQLANLKHGRDSLITRLVRGETRKIDKSYKLGFTALRYYADNQRASLLLAKNDDRLWLILMKLATVNMPVELREKIVDFAFFGKDAPERKANKAVEEDEDDMSEEDEDEMLG